MLMGLREGITFPLIFKIFKPKSRLQEKDVYKTKPQLAIEIIHELIEMGFKFRLVLADSLYGESGDFIEALNQHQLQFVVEDEVTTGSGCLKDGGYDTPGGKNSSAFFLMETHKGDTCGKLFLANDATLDIGRLLLTRSSYRKTVPG